MTVISHIWHWLVSFTGTVALIFLIISAAIILIEAAMYRKARRQQREKEGRT